MCLKLLDFFYKPYGYRSSAVSDVGLLRTVCPNNKVNVVATIFIYYFSSFYQDINFNIIVC